MWVSYIILFLIKKGGRVCFYLSTKEENENDKLQRIEDHRGVYG
jgi:hypothetical protein